MVAVWCPMKWNKKNNVIIPFVLQLIPACVLIQACLVHTDPQDSKERKKTGCNLCISQNRSVFICMEKTDFLYCGKPNGMGLSTWWKTQSFRWAMKKNSPSLWKVSESYQMVHTDPVSFCLLKMLTVSLGGKFSPVFPRKWKALQETRIRNYGVNT